MKRDEFSKEQLRTFILIFCVLAVSGMMLLAKYFFEGIVYTGFLIIGITVMLNFDKVMKIAGVKGDPSVKFLGISKKWVRGSTLGLLFGGAFLLLTKVKVFGAVITLAVPTVPLSLGSQGVVVCLLAPICETVFFTMAVLSILSLFLPLWIAILIKAGLFMSYHFWAYVILAGNTLESVIGSFIGAAIFGIIGSILAYYWGAEADIVSHGTINTINFNNMYHFFSVAGGSS